MFILIFILILVVLIIVHEFGHFIVAKMFGIRVDDAQHAYDRAVELGAWPAEAEPIGPSELGIPAIQGVGDTHLYFVDRWRGKHGARGGLGDISIYDIDFRPLDAATAHEDWHHAGVGLARVDHLTQTVGPGRAVPRAIPRESIVGCFGHASGNISAPGHIQQSGGMRYILGDPDGASETRAQSVAEALCQAGMEAPIVSTIQRELWRKLLGNVSLNPVSALTRRTIGMMLRDAEVRALIGALMRETIDVAAACGVDVAIRIEERIEFAARLNDVKTSMLQDAEAGRPLEIDPIVGAVVELAGELGVKVEALRLIYTLAKALSA